MQKAEQQEAPVGTRWRLAMGPLELIDLRTFPQGVHAGTCQFSYLKFVW